MTKRLRSQLPLFCIIAASLLLSVCGQPATLWPTQESQEEPEESKEASVLKIIDAASEGHSKVVKSIDWNPSLSQVATGSDDGTVKLWYTSTWKPTRTINTEGRVSAVAYSPNGKYLAIAFSYRKLEIWDVTKNGNEPVKAFGKAEIGSGITCLAWSYNGSLLAAGDSWAENTIIFNTNNWSKVQDVNIGKYSSKSVMSVDFAPDGRLVSTSDGKVRIWNAGSFTAQAFLMTRQSFVAKWNPEGTLLAAGDYYDGPVMVWKAPEDGITWAQTPVSREERHAGRIKDLAWSPDGKRLASVSRAKGTTEMVILWKVTYDGELQFERDLSGAHLAGSIVFSVAWSPDGTKLVTGGGDARIVIWNV